LFVSTKTSFLEYDTWHVCYVLSSIIPQTILLLLTLISGSEIWQCIISYWCAPSTIP
jgi:hypothetical protein